ncbi:non-ribosomal peptide synthetase [Clostridium botulinum]|uniref:non-ribosomal peptide synthetase n=1 Tax=Clostridium botulinum TaxID=1491 RepID=UPI001967906D|nr:non-ribosomal peptide synthetase [Clostridium botulinum]MBN1050264.1 amino acid adenylation domain-containing protein [Clostridium botulinum]
MNGVKKIDKENVQDLLELTPMEEGILFHYLKDTSSKQYVEQIRLSLTGSINIDIFMRAWELVIKSNDVLRSVFLWAKLEKPIQIILKNISLPITISDFTKDNDALFKIKSLLKEDLNTRIDISEQPLRINLCMVNENYSEMIITFHHILYDGWSNGIIIEEFLRNYNDLIDNNMIQQKLKSNYKNYKKWLCDQNKNEQENFWSKYLKGFNSKTKLPYVKTKINEIKDYSNYDYKFSNELSNNILNFVKENKITVAALLYTAWGVLLQRYNDVDDIVFGTTVSGRTIDINMVENMVGLFINTIPLRIKSNKSICVVDLLENVNKSMAEREKYEQTPIIDINKYSDINKRDSLFDSILVIENYPLDQVLLKSNKYIQVGLISIDEMTNFDLTVKAICFNGIELEFSYNNDVFNSDSIKNIMVHYVNLIEEMISNPNEKISKLKIIVKEEENKLLKEFNNTEYEMPSDITILDFFIRQTKLNPNKIAIKSEYDTLTYEELDKQSNQLANFLINKGVRQNDIVGIMIERSSNMMVAIIGILKTGAAYLPIDIRCPAKRIEYILNDSKSNILLVNKVYKEYIDFDGEIITINDVKNAENSEYCEINIVNQNNIAYVIYTSGSTGLPKGVIIDHKALLNRLLWMNRKYLITKDDVFIQKTPYTFDVSVWELLLWMIEGGTLSIISQDGEKDPDAIINQISRDNVTVIHFVPSMLAVFLEYIESKKNAYKLKSLTKVFCSGEALAVNHVTKFKELVYKVYETQLHNLYGPTEASIDVTYFDCINNDIGDFVPIGKPIDNTMIYILDKNNNLQPIGVQGELCISGIGLARGYINREDLNKERFIENPFETYSNVKRIYKTGDLARWTYDGNIEYLGRNDNQVKVRGYRIELSEIERQILILSYVKEVAIIVNEDKNNNKIIIAYLVGDKDILVEKLKQDVSNVLPEYMIPDYFIQVDKMPLSQNGKIDRKELMNIKVQNKENVEKKLPQTVLEGKIAKIWSAILDKNQIGVNDNFFDIGGNSILLIRMHSRLEKEFPNKVNVSDLFSYPTIEDIAKHIELKGLDNNKIEIKYITIPDEYLVKEYQNNKDNFIKANIKSNYIDRLSQIADEEDVDLESILVSLLVYLLNKITKSNYITLEVATKINKLKFISVDIDEVTNMSSLIRKVKYLLGQNDSNNEYEIENLTKISQIKRRNEVSVLFNYNKVMTKKVDLCNYYDLIMETSTSSDGVSLVVEFNSNKLLSNKIQSLFEKYIKLIKIMNHKDK